MTLSCHCSRAPGRRCFFRITIQRASQRKESQTVYKLSNIIRFSSKYSTWYLFFSKKFEWGWSHYTKGEFQSPLPTANEDSSLWEFMLLLALQVQRHQLSRSFFSFSRFQLWFFGAFGCCWRWRLDISIFAKPCWLLRWLFRRLWADFRSGRIDGWCSSWHIWKVNRAQIPVSPPQN